MELVMGHPGTRITVERWPSEMPLFVFSLLVAAFLWMLLTVTVIGLIYVLAIGIFLFISHVVLVAHIRGSAVKLGPDQFPDLYERVAALAQRMEMPRLPDIYLMQAGGTLNAFATRFLRANFIVLYSDLLDACAGNDAARDMIIGHELGHIKAGHLRWHWFLLPALIVPFLGTALSRSREFTCDRYGREAAGDREGAALGLAILAAGAKRGPLVNRRAMVQQAEDLETGWMTIGTWLATHPPLARRLAENDLALSARTGPERDTGAARAAAIIAVSIVGIIALSYTAGVVIPVLLGVDQEQPAADAGYHESNGSMDDVPFQVDQYLEAESRAASLAFTVDGVIEDWLAISERPVAGGTRLSFPLTSPTQADREPALVEYCNSAGMVFEITVHQNGNVFLDCFLAAGADPSEAVIDALTRVYGARPNSDIFFTARGYQFAKARRSGLSQQANIP